MKMTELTGWNWRKPFKRWTQYRIVRVSEPGKEDVLQAEYRHAWWHGRGTWWTVKRRCESLEECWAAVREHIQIERREEGTIETVLREEDAWKR